MSQKFRTIVSSRGGECCPAFSEVVDENGNYSIPQAYGHWGCLCTINITVEEIPDDEIALDLELHDISDGSDEQYNSYIYLKSWETSGVSATISLEDIEVNKPEYVNPYILVNLATHKDDETDDSRYDDVDIGLIYAGNGFWDVTVNPRMPKKGDPDYDDEHFKGRTGTTSWFNTFDEVNQQWTTDPNLSVIYDGVENYAGYIRISGSPSIVWEYMPDGRFVMSGYDDDGSPFEISYQLPVSGKHELTMVTSVTTDSRNNPVNVITQGAYLTNIEWHDLMVNMGGEWIPFTDMYRQWEGLYYNNTSAGIGAVIKDNILITNVR